MCAIKNFELTQQTDLQNAQGESLYAKQQEKRDTVAGAVHEKRKERDDLIKNSKSILTRIYALFGKSESPEDLKYNADNIQRNNQEVISREKRNIALETIKEIQNALEETVREPLRELSSSAHGLWQPYKDMPLHPTVHEKISQQKEKAVEQLSIENFSVAMNDIDLRAEIIQDVKRFFDTGYDRLTTIVNKDDGQNTEQRVDVRDIARATLKSMFDADSQGEIFADAESTLKILSNAGPFIKDKLNDEGKQKICSVVEKQLDMLNGYSLSQFSDLIQYTLEVEKSKNIKDKIDNQIESLFKEHQVSQIESLMRSSGYIAELAFQKFNTYIETKFNISATAVEDAWGLKMQGNRDAFEWDISGNLGAMDKLEQERPGICKILLEEFGIKEFRRYPMEILVRQFDEREKDVPYGAVLFTNTDHNQAFDRKSDALTHAFKDMNDKLAMRVVEFDSRIDLMKGLIKLDQQYGNKNKLSYLIVGAHGSGTGFSAGDRSGVHKSAFVQEEGGIKGRGVQRLNGFLKDEAEIVLLSCSTGEAGGLGEAISKNYDKTVIAPSVPVSVKDIQVSFGENDMPHFDVKYSEKDSKRVFKSGIAESV